MPVYKEVEGFFSINGFAEAVANAIVAQGNSAVDQRYALAQHVEEKGVEHGREAARILREMNTQSAVLPWELPGSHIELPLMPGWQVERTPDGGAKGICESGIQFFLNGQGCGGVDVQAGEQLSRRIILDEFDSEPFEKPAAPTTYELNRAALAKAKAEKAALDASLRCGFIARGSDLHRTMLGDIAECLRVSTEQVTDLAAKIAEDANDSIGRMERSSKFSAITSMIPFNGYWIELKVERAEEVGNDDTDDAEDTGPEYDTVSQDDIDIGDIVEWHTEEGVERWEVSSTMAVNEKHQPLVEKGAVTLRSITVRSDIFGDVYQTVFLPLAGDPFILRPRS